jgi:glycosyltransferase involved in cell wall biosynthesis
VVFHKTQTRADEARASVREVAPLVSIVTPSLNQGRFLRRTIESVLTQDYPNIEYTVIDGGSTDESIDVLKSYQGRIAWISEPDRGQANAINKGFYRSKGNILSYLNSDDTLCANAVSAAVEHFVRSPQTDLLYGKGNYIDINDSVTGTYPTADYTPGRLMVDCCICQPAAFWSERIARRVGPFNEDLNFVMDYDYWLRIEKLEGNIEHIPVPLGNTRIYPETKTMSNRAQIFKEIFHTTRKHGGYVGRNFVQWYWHYRLWEQPGTIEKIIRAYPSITRRLIEADIRRLATKRGTWIGLALHELSAPWRKASSLC